MRTLIDTVQQKTPRPYADASVGAGLIFTSGHLPTAEDGSTPQSFTEQVLLTLENLQNTLEAAGAGMDDVLRMTVYLASMDDFDEYNRIYASKLGPDFPARTTIEVSRFRGEKKIEVDAIALAPQAPMGRRQ